MTLASYTQALEQAERISVEIEQAMAVIYWDYKTAFTAALLTSYTESCAGFPGCTLAASVDHHGIITESRWVKEQLGLAGVAV